MRPMKIEVLYISRGGSTKRIAEAIASEAKTEAKDLKKKPAISKFDMAFIGSGNYGGKPDKEIVELPERVSLKGKKIAIFGTFGGQWNAINEMEEFFSKAGARVIGKWGCRGKFLFFSRKNPTDDDLKNARDFAKEMIKELARHSAE